VVAVLVEQGSAILMASRRTGPVTSVGQGELVPFVEQGK
jgi:hypothetical protein